MGSSNQELVAGLRKKKVFAFLIMLAIVLGGHLFIESRFGQSADLDKKGALLYDAASRLAKLTGNCSELRDTYGHRPLGDTEKAIQGDLFAIKLANDAVIRDPLVRNAVTTEFLVNSKLETQFHQLHTAATEFSQSLQGSDSTAVNKKFDDVEKFSSEYVNSLNTLGYNILEARIHQSETAKYVTLAFGAAILLSMVFVYRMILTPQMRLLHKFSADLEITSDELRVKNEDLEVSRALLTKQNFELTLKQADLENLNVELEDSQKLYGDAARRLEELFQNVPVACFGYDVEGVVHEWNREASKVFSLKSYEALDRGVSELFVQPDEESGIEGLLRAPFQGNVVEAFMWKRITPEGETRWIQSSTFPVIDGNGRIVGALCASIDFTQRFEYEQQIEANMLRINEYSIELEMQRNELQKANGRLENLATTDGLTGLRNHRNFQERLESEVQIAKKNGTPLSLILMDVDHFKKFNDSFGHQAGDEVLRGVSKVMQVYGIEPFTAARYGGEEFVIVAPGLTEIQAMDLANEVRTKIEDAKPTNRVVTASMGVSTWQGTMRSRAELIAQADKALYASKEAGRNRVTLASSIWSSEEAA